MTTPSADNLDLPPAPKSPSASEIREWLVTKLSEAQGTPPSEIRTDAPLIGMGLDSMQFVVLVGEMEQWLGCRFTDNPLIDYPTIDTLADFLANQLAQGKTLIDPTQG
ncbi:MAG: acyl carrier protein [Planctomycetaceae bacterium]|nr:acyl carrier protein [Planctomycetaceae bacterium]